MDEIAELTGLEYIGALASTTLAAFRERRGRLLGIIAIATAVTGGIVWLLPQQWKAQVALQIGHVDGELVEGPPLVARRVETPGFKLEVLKSLGMKPSVVDPKSALFLETLAAQVINGTDLVQLSIRAYSRADAIRQLQATLDLLRSRESSVMEARTKMLRERLAAIDDYSQSLKALQASVVRSITERSKAGHRAGTENNEETLTAALARSLIRELSAQVLQLRQERIEVEQQLSPTQTYPAQALEPVYADEEPVRPRRALSVFLAFLLSSLVGMSWAIAMLHRDRSRSST